MFKGNSDQHSVLDRWTDTSQFNNRWPDRFAAAWRPLHILYLLGTLLFAKVVHVRTPGYMTHVDDIHSRKITSRVCPLCISLWYPRLRLASLAISICFMVLCSRLPAKFFIGLLRRVCPNVYLSGTFGPDKSRVAGDKNLSHRRLPAKFFFNLPRR